MGHTPNMNTAGATGIGNYTHRAVTDARVGFAHVRARALMAADIMAGLLGGRDSAKHAKAINHYARVIARCQKG